MWESGDWWFPHRGQELYSDKPPLYFWLLGASYALVRDWTVAFLLPSLLAALGTLWLTFDLGCRLWGRRAGLWAAAAVLCAFQFAYQAKRAQSDPTVVFFITLGFYGLGRHLLLGPHWRWFWAGCFAAGLGVFTKGGGFLRSEEHTSELQSLMRISYAVFCLKKKTKNNNSTTHH